MKKKIIYSTIGVLLLAVISITTILIFNNKKKAEKEVITIFYHIEEEVVREKRIQASDMKDLVVFEYEDQTKTVKDWYFEKELEVSFKVKDYRKHLNGGILNLYGEIREKEKVTITIENFSNVEGEQYSEELVIGTYFNFPFELVPEGFIHLGYFLENGEEIKGSFITTENLTIYSKYEDDPEYDKNTYYNVRFELFGKSILDEDLIKNQLVNFPAEKGDIFKEIEGMENEIYRVISFYYYDITTGKEVTVDKGLRITKDLIIHLKVERVIEINIKWSDEIEAGKHYSVFGENINLNDIKINQDFDSLLTSGKKFYYKINENFYEKEDVVVSLGLNELKIEVIVIEKVLYELFSFINFIKSETELTKIEFTGNKNFETSGNDSFIVSKITDKQGVERLAKKTVFSGSTSYKGNWFENKNALVGYNSKISTTTKTQTDEEFQNFWSVDNILNKEQFTSISFDILEDRHIIDYYDEIIYNLSSSDDYNESNKISTFNDGSIYKNFAEDDYKKINSTNDLNIIKPFELNNLNKNFLMNDINEMFLEGNELVLVFNKIFKNALLKESFSNLIGSDIEESENFELRILQNNDAFVVRVLSKTTNLNLDKFINFGLVELEERGKIFEETELTINILK